MDSALACSHGQGGKAELFSLSSKETKKKQKCLVSVLEKQVLWPHRKEREQWSFAVTSGFFFFFFKFSCRDFSIPKGRQERQLYFQNSYNAALSNGLNTKEVCWKFLIG